jgi:hypothetical protein
MFLGAGRSLRFPLHLNPTMDSNITVKIMAILADEAGEQLLAAHEQLIKDDETSRLGE